MRFPRFGPGVAERLAGFPRRLPAPLADRRAAHYVDFVREGAAGDGAARTGHPRWLRLTEMHAGSARSVFQFNGPGSIAKATHAGLPWLRFIRQRLPGAVHFWPFDGWDIAGGSVVAEVRPALCRKSFAREGRTADQHAAFCISAWLAQADRDGALTAFLKPDLEPAERTIAKVEGWILGVPGSRARLRNAG